MSLHAGVVPSYFQYPALAGCIQPGTQPHVIQHGARTVPQLCNGGVKFVLQPAATIPVAPPPPLCITSLVLTPVSGFQGEQRYSDNNVLLHISQQMPRVGSGAVRIGPTLFPDRRS